MPTKIAKTVQAVANLKNPLAKAIMDRRTKINRAFVERVISLTQFTWHGRRPRSAFDKHGVPRQTDLDLFSLLVELYRRQAKITLPAYQNLHQWQIRDGVQHAGGTERRGVITGLISHHARLTLSVKIRDESLVQYGSSTGSFEPERTYTVTGLNGYWHEGWHGATWEFTPEEAEFLEQLKLLYKGQINCQYPVHPHRRQSIFGAPYLLLKLLWQRIEDELHFLGRELSRLEKSGVNLPIDLNRIQPTVVARGNSRNVFAPHFNCELVGLSHQGEYDSFNQDEAGYRQAYERQQFLLNELRPLVQFVVRADEVAFFHFGREKGYVASWIKGPRWQHNKLTGWTTLRLGRKLSLRYFAAVYPVAVAA